MLPPGTVVSAVKPAAMRWWMTFPMTVVDTLFKAMAQGDAGPRDRRAPRRPARVASSTASRRRTAASSSAACGPLGGGWGAKHNEDGMSATVCMNDGDTHNRPMRADGGEVSAALRAPRAARGFGRRGPPPRRPRHRAGGARAVAPITINVQVDRMHCPPWGLEGGLPGAGNQVTLRLAGKSRRPTCRTPRC